MLRVSDRAESSDELALTPTVMLPSPSLNKVGTPDSDFAAQYLAYAFPCQRFADILTEADA